MKFLKALQGEVSTFLSWARWRVKVLESKWSDMNRSNLKVPRLRRALPMFLKLQEWSKGWEDGWTKMPMQTYCTFDHGGCHAPGITTWICETLDADGSSTVPKKLCERRANEISAPLRSEEVHAMREVVNSMQGTGSDGTDCYPATAHLLHFDNLIFDMWFIVIHTLLLTRTCALFDHLVIIKFSAVWTFVWHRACHDQNCLKGSVDLMRNKTQAMELLGPLDTLEELFFLDIKLLVSIHRCLNIGLPIAWFPKFKQPEAALNFPKAKFTWC